MADTLRAVFASGTMTVSETCEQLTAARTDACSPPLAATTRHDCGTDLTPSVTVPGRRRPRGPAPGAVQHLRVGDLAAS
jgi:hypothetical protein